MYLCWNASKIADVTSHLVPMSYFVRWALFLHKITANMVWLLTLYQVEQSSMSCVAMWDQSKLLMWQLNLVLGEIRATEEWVVFVYIHEVIFTVLLHSMVLKFWDRLGFKPKTLSLRFILYSVLTSWLNVCHGSCFMKLHPWNRQVQRNRNTFWSGIHHKVGAAQLGINPSKKCVMYNRLD